MLCGLTESSCQGRGLVENPPSKLSSKPKMIIAEPARLLRGRTIVDTLWATVVDTAGQPQRMFSRPAMRSF